MESKVVLKRSNVSGKKPTVNDLDFGELAINTNDGRAYIKKDDGSGEEVVDIGSKTLVELEDTDITTPVNGACLKYEETSAKWVDADPMVIEIPELSTDLIDFSSVAPTDGQGLVFNSGKWIPTDIVISNTLQELNDTNIAAPGEGEVLTYVSGEWKNKPAGSIDTTLFVKSDITGISGASKILNMVSITQADYDNIAVKDPETLYLIKG